MCASNFPPGGLAAATTPQFILVTHDDAVNAYSNKVVRSLTDGHLNANGCNVPATWYTLQTGSECEIVKRLWEQNHEIALHTQHHAPLVVNFQGDLKEEMLGVRAWLNTTCGIPLEEIVGFRAPYLVHNPAVRAVEAAAGLLYDASMIETFSADSLVETAPGQRVWPFTMDAGIPIDCNWNYPDGQCNGTTERYPGLWEVPLWELQNAAGEHLFTMDPAGDVYSILVDNFNMNYGGNRAPFGIFLHATWFTPENTAAANRFLAWALAQPDVWAVTTRQLLDWMRAPVPAAQMASWLTCAPVNLSDTPGDTPCQLYTVRIGDSSYSVATQFAVLTDDFLALNPDLGDGSRLAVDQQVKIPPWDATCVGAAVLAVTAPGVPAVPGAAGAPAAAPGPAAPPCRTYAVAAGDYWHAVADKFAVAVNDLVQANPGLAADTTLTAGSTLRIPPYPMTCSTPGAAQPATGEDPPAPASGLNATMRLAGRTQASFQTELEAPFVAAVARALGVPPADGEGAWRGRAGCFATARASPPPTPSSPIHIHPAPAHPTSRSHSPCPRPVQSSWWTPSPCWPPPPAASPRPTRRRWWTSPCAPPRPTRPVSTPTPRPRW
jgi:LysM repeat protein